MMAAAIGISYSIPIHEMKLRMSSIKHILNEIEKDPVLHDLYLRQLIDIVKDTEEIITAVASMMSRQKMQKVSLATVAKNVRIIKERELEKNNIEFEIKGTPDLVVDAVPGLLNTAVLNLVDNAIYWLRAKKIQQKKENIDFQPRIEIEIYLNDSNKSTLVVRDNGFGLEDPFELLTEPYYSRKSDGLGLGLYLVNEIMMRINGKFYGYNNNGANFELTF